MKRIITGLIIVMMVTLLPSCNRNRLDVDVSGIVRPPIHIMRMDADMFEMNPDSVLQKTPEMIKKYGRFYARFITGVINTGGLEDSSYQYNLKRFLLDADMREAYSQCKEMFQDVQFLESGIAEAFQYYHYHFPEKPVPEVIAYMSGFNYSIAYSDSVLGIGLEMYLGEDNKFYKMLKLPQYRVRRMTKDYMVSDAIYGWLESELSSKQTGTTFLDQVVHTGKVLYLLDALLPQVEDSIKINYTTHQLAWAKKLEANTWEYLVNNKLVYTTESKDIIKFTGEAPFTSPFGKESAPRIGNWIGWQIVRTYMNRHPEISLEQLLNEPDAQKILSLSKYKPR